MAKDPKSITPRLTKRFLFNSLSTIRMPVTLMAQGSKLVEFSITDPNGETVWSAVEQSPRYCAFGGDAGCAIWSFPPKGNRWPNGKPVCKGDGYQAQMTVRTTDPGRDNALWQFNFAIDGDYPPC